MNYKIFFKMSVLSVLMAAVLLTGCSGGNGSSDGSQSGINSPSGTQSKTETDSQSGDLTTVPVTAPAATIPAVTVPTETTPAETTDEPVVSDTGSNSESTENTASTVPAETEGGTVPPQTYNKEYFSNDLFIGDSIFTGLYLYGFLDKNNVFAAVGLNPESAFTYQDEGVTCIQKARDMQPRNIYIMLGTNGLAFLDGSYMAEKMNMLSEVLKQACPTARIYILSIPPVTKAHEAEGNETMAKVNSYNSELKSRCGHTYIDICSKLKNDEGYFSSEYAEADGLHFLGVTYKTVLKYIETVTG